MIFGTRSWRNWQTHYLEVVARQLMEVQILSSASKPAREFHPQGAIRGCEQIERSRLTIFAKSVK